MLDGIVTDDKPSHSEKALAPIEDMVDGISTSISPLHFVNAPSPIVSIVLDNVEMVYVLPQGYLMRQLLLLLTSIPLTALYILFPLLTENDVNFVHPEKARGCIVVTLAGIVILVRDVQSSNAE